MLLSAFWKRLTKRRRRVSFYESDLMRKAAETSGPVNISWLTDEALDRIVTTEPHTLRAEAAHHELEMRARERRAAAMSVSEVLTR
jgi:hypothetical protein